MNAMRLPRKLGEPCILANVNNSTKNGVMTFPISFVVTGAEKVETYKINAGVQNMLELDIQETILLLFMAFILLQKIKVLI